MPKIIGRKLKPARQPSTTNMKCWYLFDAYTYIKTGYLMFMKSKSTGKKHEKQRTRQRLYCHRNSIYSFIILERIVSLIFKNKGCIKNACYI